MRIRRRPPGQPLGYLLPSATPAPQPPSSASGDRQERPAGDNKEKAPGGWVAVAPERGRGSRGRALRGGGIAGIAAAGNTRAASFVFLNLICDSVVERGSGLQGAQQQRCVLLENGHHHVA
ncbi:hypothetical protein BAE44_0023516 [Dichanthelium oligosanthes]|uniref:Uncharacterized protein n=1 Tax=Dichanthelium oligosanthes TaxID=888268 RepID=A0A1E5URM7_9POAL|nr:hypothetical protein BAE44_0023516 [Dichanthelium oligosanthes]